MTDYILDSLGNRVGHVVVTHKTLILVWGGTTSTSSHLSSKGKITIYDSADKSWNLRQTTGYGPTHSNFATAQIVREQLYVLCGQNYSYSNDVYALDLNTWTWKKMDPSGTKPFECFQLTSWVHDDSIFIFGGYSYPKSMGRDGLPRDCSTRNGMSNQLVEYDTRDDSWSWPKCTGDAPTPRYRHASFVHESKAYVFGGCMSMDAAFNTLFILDHESWHWEKVVPKGDHPKGRWDHSMTLVSRDQAVMYGGQNSLFDLKLRDHWTYDIKDNRWFRRKDFGGERAAHQAVFAQESRQVWVIGGSGMMRKRNRWKIVRLELEPVRLLTMVLEVVVEESERLEQLIALLPKAVQELISNHASAK